MASIPAVHALETRYQARGLRVMSVTEIDPDDREEGIAAVAAAVAKHGMDQPCLLDEDARWMDSADAPRIPSFLVVNKAGEVVHVQRGKLLSGSQQEATLVKALEAVL